MFSQDIVIQNPTGLHARPASQLAELSKKFTSQIRIVTDEASIDPKSILSILSGGVKSGTEVSIQVEGEDETEAGPAIISFLENLKE